nr:MAG TPA: hypothetical protein [Caudoviricetes sp.]
MCNQKSKRPAKLKITCFSERAACQNGCLLNPYGDHHDLDDQANQSFEAPHTPILNI